MLELWEYYSGEFFLHITETLLASSKTGFLQSTMYGFLVVLWWFTAILLLLKCVVAAEVVTCSSLVPMRLRADEISIKDFGGVGDGQTLNTKAFQDAMSEIELRKSTGGTLLYVPTGVYLTGSFNLTSHMTLYLAKGAIIKATQVFVLAVFMVFKC